LRGLPSSSCFVFRPTFTGMPYLILSAIKQDVSVFLN
jgi:hypothetical protein